MLATILIKDGFTQETKPLPPITQHLWRMKAKP